MSAKRRVKPAQLNPTKTTGPSGLLVFITHGAAEPMPRKPVGQVVKVASPLTYISGVAELPDGRLIVTDHRPPRVSLIAQGTGQVTAIGSVGAGSGQFVRPGGFYGTARGL